MALFCWLSFACKSADKKFWWLNKRGKDFPSEKIKPILIQDSHTRLYAYLEILTQAVTKSHLRAAFLKMWKSAGTFGKTTEPGHKSKL